MEIAVIGGGIVGCAAAAFLAETGATVTLYERERIAAGASGRNQGVLQNPLDPLLTPLYRESLRLHAETAPGLGLDRPPDGLLLVSHSAELVADLATSIARSHPEAEPTLLADAHTVEPALATGVAACRLDTGHQVPPEAVTEAWARRAEAAGARLELGRTVTPADVPGDAVFVACGPWSPVRVIPIWGVTVQTRYATPPAHPIEEAVIESIATMAGEVPPAFASVTASGVTTIGATFLADEPDHVALAPALLAHATSFLPETPAAVVLGSRACARPVSPDGYPLLGPLDDDCRTWVATGNGPWGISCGPATARLAVDALLGRAEIPPAFASGRFAQQSSL
jgi:glycine/D-amino acid oxidase-like deaminating enzyme